MLSIATAVALPGSLLGAIVTAKCDSTKLPDTARPGPFFGSDGSVSDDYVDRIGHGTAVTAAIKEKAPDADFIAIKIFELGPEYAGLTVDGLEAGSWRELTAREVEQLRRTAQPPA